MTNVKISALSPITGADTATDDVYLVVDNSVPETKKQSRAELFQNIPAASFTDTATFNASQADKDTVAKGTADPDLLHVDASTDRVGIGTPNPVAKLHVLGSIAFTPPVTVTTDYAVDDTAVFIISNRAASNTLTLQNPASCGGRMLLVKTVTANSVVSASSNVVGRASTTPSANILAATDGAWALLVSDGTNWVIMAGS